MAKGKGNRDKLWEEVGTGNEEADCERWQQVFSKVWEEHSIDSNAALANATGIPKGTLHHAHAFENPGAMTYELFARVCVGLGLNACDLCDEFTGISPIDVETYMSELLTAHERVRRLISAFVNLSKAQQDTIVSMVEAVQPEHPEESDAERFARGALLNQIEIAKLLYESHERKHSVN